MQALQGFVCSPFTQKFLFAIKDSRQPRTRNGLSLMPTTPDEKAAARAPGSVFTNITGPCLLRGGPGQAPRCLRSASCQRKCTGEV